MQIINFLKTPPKFQTRLETLSILFHSLILQLSNNWFFNSWLNNYWFNNNFLFLYSSEPRSSLIRNVSLQDLCISSLRSSMWSPIFFLYKILISLILIMFLCVDWGPARTISKSVLTESSSKDLWSHKVSVSFK